MANEREEYRWYVGALFPFIVCCSMEFYIHGSPISSYARRCIYYSPFFVHILSMTSVSVSTAWVHFRKNKYHGQLPILTEVIKENIQSKHLAKLGIFSTTLTVVYTIASFTPGTFGIVKLPPITLILLAVLNVINAASSVRLVEQAEQLKLQVGA